MLIVQWVLFWLYLSLVIYLSLVVMPKEFKSKSY